MTGTHLQGLLFDMGGTYLRAGLAASNGTIHSVTKTRICSVAGGFAAPLTMQV